MGALSSKPSEKEKRAQRLDRSARTGILSLSGNKLKKIPVRVLQNKTLRTLDLSCNQIPFVPRSLLNLTLLKTLNLNKNLLQTTRVDNVLNSALPRDLRSLSKLQKLSLDNNRLTELPLLPTSLQRLTASGNKLSNWPTSIESLAKLVFLDLSHNVLRQVVIAEDHKLQQLTHISFDNNSLECIPQALAKCIKLENLSVQANRISTIPPDVLKMTVVNRINLFGNPGVYRSKIMNISGFDVFENRRKLRIDKEIRAGMDVSEHTALCGLET